MKYKKQKIKATPTLGEGIFLSTDIANILNLPYHKVIYCMKGFWHLHTFGEQRNKAINFYSLIEFYVFYQLRTHQVSSQKIKKLHAFLSNEFKTQYPFAHSEISTDGKALWFKKMDNLIKHDGKNQFDFEKIIEPFLKKVEFGKNNIAERYFPLKDSKNIVVDPKHQFGQPTIFGTNIKTKTIYNLYNAGEPQKIICNLYNIPPNKVKDAINFHKPAA